MLQSSFSNFSMEAFYTNCHSNTLEQWVPLLRTLQSAFLMWHFNWIMKIFGVDHVQRLLNKAPDLLLSVFPQPKVHPQRMLHKSQQNPWDTRVSYLATYSEALKLHFDMKWNPNIKYQSFAQTEKLKIFSFNAIKMCDSTGAKPFFFSIIQTEFFIFIFLTHMTASNQSILIKQ